MARIYVCIHMLFIHLWQNIQFLDACNLLLFPSHTHILARHVPSHEMATRAAWFRITVFTCHVFYRSVHLCMYVHMYVHLSVNLLVIIRLSTSLSDYRSLKYFFFRSVYLPDREYGGVAVSAVPNTNGSFTRCTLNITRF